MRKKKLVLLGMVVVILVIAAVLIIIRGRDKSPTASEEEIASMITDVICSETMPGEDLPLSQQYANAVVNAVSYEIIKIEDTGKAVVKFTYVDAMKMAEDYGPVTDPDEFYGFCIRQIQNNNTPMAEVTIDIEYITLADGTKEIVDSIAFADVLTGGAASEFLKLMEGW